MIERANDPTSPETELLRIRGARIHNLKNIDLDIPRDQLVVITGPSGSGKSSLAFDTIHAEGQRQYLESLSTYARQFLNQLERPDVDLIEGLQPTIAINQNAGARNPRSTVGTITEIYDYLRVLYARLGVSHCPGCDAPIQQQTPEEIVDVIFAMPEGTKAILLAPMVRGRKGEHAEAFAAIRKAGFVRVRVNGELYDLDSAPALEPQSSHTIEAVVDRIVVRESARARIAESVNLAVKHGENVIILSFPTSEGGWRDQSYSTEYACPDCKISFEEVEPRTFSFNSPYGACTECHGLGKPGKPKGDAATPDNSDEVICPACGGARLRPEARAVRVAGLAIHQFTALSITDAAKWIASLQFPDDAWPIAKPLVREVSSRLSFMIRVGLDYLTLDRVTETLSGGELQRVRLATGIGSGLVGVCYVLDEPSIGLHPRDNARLNGALRDLQQQGNSVLVVEHDEAIMREADHLIDFGPGAGVHGGEIVYEGSFAAIQMNPNSITGQFLSGARRIEIAMHRRPINSSRAIRVVNARANSLQNVSVSFPLDVFTCVTGVSGSGKSSLVSETLVRAINRQLNGGGSNPGEYDSIDGIELIDRIVDVDQTPIGRSPRSNPATYTGLFDELRKVFAATKEARLRGYKSARFSFNAKGGRCEGCRGLGIRKIEMNFLPDLFIRCAMCDGKRFNRQTLEVKFRDRSIADALELRVDEAADLFKNFPEMQRLLDSLKEVGLGYLALGQSSNTLSGGEAQRVKLATELARGGDGNTLYVLDEPTTGLHFHEIERLLAILQRLVEAGNSVLVIEHHLDVMKSADWIIDLGPEGGAGGGRIVAEGTPEQVAAAPQSITGKCLLKSLAGRKAGS